MKGPHTVSEIHEHVPGNYAGDDVEAMWVLPDGSEIFSSGFQDYIHK